jgi:cell division protein ZapA
MKIGDAVKRSVTVEVAGQKFTLRTEADDEYIQGLAAFVNQKIAEVRAPSSSGGRTLSTHALAILAALNIADELFQARSSQDELKQRVREKAKRIGALLDKASE